MHAERRLADSAGMANGPNVTPFSVTAGAMVRPEQLDVRFEGFGREAFDVLERLRRHPHIEEYRKHKARIRSEIQEPFKRYRDDLVVNWVLPNRIDLETEKNVFSRLLKNDFGAGGCHHHYWMSFYRPGRSRLRDIQLAHSLWPEALYITAYVGKPVPDLFMEVQQRILQQQEDFLEVVNPLLQTKPASLRITYDHADRRRIITDPIVRLPERFEKAKELALRLAISRDEVVEAGPRLIELAIDSVIALWPVYRFFLEASANDSRA